MSDMSERAILHVDMDAFFAAVEQRERPELQGLPVVVGADPQGGRGRGVVAACSYEARAYGLHSAMPIGRAYRLCPQAVYLQPNGGLYRETSRRIRAVFGCFTDLVEPLSIDEAFLDVTGSQRLFGPPEEIARRIKADIWANEALNCSIGIAASKFIAKIASDLSKPNGLLQVPAGRERAFLQDLPASRIWGVGARTEARLLELGIRSIGQIAERPRAFWEERFGKLGLRLHALASGVDPRPVDPAAETLSISQETTFDEDCGDPELIERTLLRLAEGVSGRLRRQRYRARVVQLKLRFRDFSTYTRRLTLPQGADTSRDLLDVARRLLGDFLPLPQTVRLVGLGASRLERGAPVEQGGLFEAPSRLRELDQSLDAIRERFGEDSVVRASLLGGERRRGPGPERDEPTD